MIIYWYIFFISWIYIDKWSLFIYDKHKQDIFILILFLQPPATLPHSIHSESENPGQPAEMSPPPAIPPKGILRQKSTDLDLW